MQDVAGSQHSLGSVRNENEEIKVGLNTETNENEEIK